MKQKLIMNGIIVIEICIIAHISTAIISKTSSKNNAGRTININPLTATIIQKSPTDRLHNYYTLPLNTARQETAVWLPKPIVYSFNNDRLHDRYNYTHDKPTSTYRIITLGDSFVFGLWVNTAQNFSEILEDKLNASYPCHTISKFEVLNLGVPGFDLIYAVERYKELGTKYNPDLVIWFMRDENMYLNADRYHDLSSQYKKEIEIRDSSQTAKTTYDISIEASDLAYNKTAGDFFHATATQQNELLSLETSSFDELRKIFHGPVLITSDATIQERYQRFIDAFVRSSKNTYYLPVDITETFHPHDYHPSKKGHLDIASQLFSAITDRNLIECNK